MIFLIWDFQRHPKLRKHHFAAHLIYTHVKETCSESWYLNNSSQSIAILQRDIFVLLDFRTKFNKICRFSASLSNFFLNFYSGKRTEQKWPHWAEKKSFHIAWIFLRTKSKKRPRYTQDALRMKIKSFPVLIACITLFWIFGWNLKLKDVKRYFGIQDIIELNSVVTCQRTSNGCC